MSNSELTDWIRHLFETSPLLLRMGHLQRLDDANLGLGWLYYGLVRSMRPKQVVVIGSYRGFVPLVMGRALQDNLEGGKLLFIDPSFVDDFWKNPEKVDGYFRGFDVSVIEHALMTTQEFVASPQFGQLEGVEILFIDGYHSREQARFDYLAFQPLLKPGAMILFHDSLHAKESAIYGRDKVYTHSVREWIDELKRDPALQVFDFPFGDGVTLVRRLAP